LREKLHVISYTALCYDASSLCVGDLIARQFAALAALYGITVPGRAFSCRRAIAMTLSLRREHSQFLRSAIRHPPINAFAPSDKSDESAARRCT